MNCTRLRKEIVPYYTNELSPQEKETVERHLQLCEPCARFAHEIFLTIQDARATRPSGRGRNLWPDIRESIESRRFFFPRPAVSFLFSLVLVGILFTETRFMLPQRLSATELSVVKEMEFLSDYDVWEDLDVLESADMKGSEA